MKRTKDMPRRFWNILYFAAWLVLAANLSANSGNNVIYIGAEGKEASAKELADAYKQLATTGGVIVLRGPVRIKGNFEAPAHDAPVTVTGSLDGARNASAKLILNASYRVNGPTTFERLMFVTEGADYRYLHCNGHAVVLGGGIVCQSPPKGKYPTIVGASQNKTRGRSGSNVTINSGQWYTVVGGAIDEAAPTNGNLKMVVNGGRFYGAVCAAGVGRHTGDAELVINGGTFYNSVSGLGNIAAASLSGAIRVTINDGRFYNAISATRNNETEFSGSYTLSINGGIFTSVTGITGTRGVRGGAKSSVVVNPASLLDEKIRGSLSFINPIIKGADPCVFLHDGYYYCTTTGGSRLTGYKAANLSDFPYAQPVTIWQPPPRREFSKNLWSPKIYYFGAEDVGEKLAGHYLYVSANDGSDNAAADQRMYVLRSLSGDPLGPYGSPTDGELNVPARMIAAQGKKFNREWTVGPKVLHHNGKLYFIWVGRIGDRNSRNVGDHWQCLYIDEMINPWTVSGKPAMICRPTLDWEKHGAGRASDGRMLPEVVEGGAPVYSADGTLYLLYAASGYWTPHYAIGLMKLIGDDPMNPRHWQKATQPIFKASKGVIGPGNACYVPSPEGNSHWAIYHAYVGKKTKGVPRQLFAEPYEANDRGVAISAGEPLPLGTPLKIEANPMPLRKKISGFTEPLPPPDPALAADAKDIAPLPSWRQPPRARTQQQQQQSQQQQTPNAYRPSPTDWRFDKGPDPKTKGDLRLSGNTLRLTADFSRGKRYVGAVCPVAFPDVSRVSFNIRTNQKKLLVRLKDRTGQIHQHGFNTKPGEPETIVVPFEAGLSGKPWGGANDGKMHLPVGEFEIILAAEHAGREGFCEITDVRLIAGPPAKPAEPLRLDDYDARKITVNGNAAVENRGNSLVVTISAGQKISWPGINLRPQNGTQFFDLARCSVLAMDVRNLTGAQIGIKCQIENPGSNGRENCIRGGIALNAGESGTMRVRYYRNGIVPDDVKIEGVKNSPEGLKGRCTLNLARITNIMLFANPLGAEVKFEVSNIRLEEPFAGAPDALKSASTFYPAFDRYGQYKHKDWPGKTRADTDLAKDLADEDADLAANPRPPSFNRYGGWADGPALEATGAFRTAKHGGMWWLVDPDGKLFFSHGINQFYNAELTGVTLREHYFENLPEKNSPGGRGLWRKQAYLAGTPNFYRDKKVTPDAFDFFGANLRRKHGDDWAGAHKKRLYARAESWGVNTLANWTHKDYIRDGRMPYVGQVGTPDAVTIKGHGGSAARFFQDVFDPGFEEAIEKALRKNWAFAANDPMCIGFFVDNEHAWGGETALAEAVLRSPASQPAKREFARRLEEKYGGISNLNAAWKTRHASFAAFLSSTQPPDRAAARADLVEFNNALSDRYFEGARNAVRRFAPGRLYLGCRFQTVPSAAIMRSAAKFCDVVSFNLYEFSVEALRLPDAIDTPVIIGEFHFGTIANGHFHPGLQGCADDADRARAYRRYVEGALRNPLIVGTHYYRLIDQCPTGRSLDDESFQYGFLSITDRPYPDMVDAARAVARRMYNLRAGAGG
ncbi:GH43 family beta-xylosidase [Ereboglobus sp. PH5-5]|uniref:family 43 glycosylhydrolase n=1 Tax=Ereboglobus sp. PH5-5 TaxID=2940529 RepID=UPI0024050253|nr:family 43 glycosylhydrolase [Ereboglobus sp. PH5-5]MDF9834215.1 GH43 family beta-xylosidase [Ereboglobus sp. PH5-5]